MKAPLSALKEYLQLTQPPEVLAEILTLAGIEVDGIEQKEGDVLFELSLTPNLGHCMSLYGLARELSSHLNIPLKKPSFSMSEVKEPIGVEVHLLDKKQCLRYTCRMVRGIKVAASPDWLRKKIEACGLRSVNNVVDIGNLVMLEFGQPLHMFDADEIEGNKIFIASHTSYGEIQALNEVSYPIPPETLLICDAKKPLAIAGIIGGASSAVTEKTTNILIEAAYFTPQSTRKTSRLLSLKTDASQRFEKGIDPAAILDCLNYAAALLHKVAGGHVAHGVIDQLVHEFHPKKIACRVERANRLIGMHLSCSEVANLLRRLHMQIVEETPHQLLVAVPTFRNDISSEIDLIEEIARLYGYNRIPKSIPVHVSSTLSHAPIYLVEKEAKKRLMSEGLQELITCDLISPAQASLALENAFPKDATISVLHSHSVDQSVLRTNLLPGLLQVVKYNVDHGNATLAGFEVGRIHFKEQDNYFEPSVAGIILTGKRAPYHFDPKPEDFDFFDLKGIVENFLAGFKIENVAFEISHLHTFHPGRQARIKVGEVIVGVFGEVHPDQIAKIDIPQRVYFAEINLNELLPLIPKQWKVSDLAQFPGSERDWTLTVADALPIETILDAVRAVPSRLLEQVFLLDLYKSEQIGKDKKNVTFRFFYRDREKTIALEAVEQEHARITAAATEHLK